MKPFVRFATGRIGAISRTRVKSNGLATMAMALIGSAVSAAAASSAMMPPRHQPTTWTGAPPLSSETRRIAVGSTSSIQCSSPSSRSENPISPYSTRYVGWPSWSMCSASEQPRRRSKHSVGAASGGASHTGGPRARGPPGDEQQGQLAAARLVGHEVAVDRALRLFLDDRGGGAPQVGETAAEDGVVDVGRRVGELVWCREGEVHGSYRKRWRSGNLAIGRLGGPPRGAREELLEQLGDAVGRLELRAVSHPVEQLIGRIRQRVEDLARPPVRHHPVAVAPHQQNGYPDLAEAERIGELGQHPATVVEVARDGAAVAEV